MGYSMRVNWSFILILTFASACQLGRPPASGSVFRVGAVVAPVVEPGVEDALRVGLAAALAAQGALGNRDALDVNLTVISASTSPTQIGANGQIHTAYLRISAQAGERKTRLSAERQYSVLAPEQADTARTAAFSALAATLTADTVQWMRYAPDGEGP